MTQCAKQHTSKNYKQANKNGTKTFTVQLLEQGHLEEVYLITTVFWKQKDSQFFFCKRTNNIHEFEGCFLRCQVSSNGLKVFNGCIVQPWMLLVSLPKSFLTRSSPDLYREYCILIQDGNLDACSVANIPWILKWIRVGFGYVWQGKFHLNPDTCGRGNFWTRIRVDRA